MRWPETHLVASLTARSAGRCRGVRGYSVSNTFAAQTVGVESASQTGGAIYSKAQGPEEEGCLGNREQLRGAAVMRARKEGGVGGWVMVRV